MTIKANPIDHEVAKMLDLYPNILALIKRKAMIKVRVEKDTSPIMLADAVGERRAWQELLSMKQRSDDQIAEATSFKESK